MDKIIFKNLIPGIPYKTIYGGFGYCSVSLIIDNDDVILFDIGHYAVRKEIIKILKKYNVNKVFISHLHYDHCLNLDLLMEKSVKVYIDKNEFNYIKNIDRNDIYTFKFIDKMINKDNLILFNKEFNISKNVYVMKTLGHSIGHSSLVFEKNKKNFILAGDAIKTYKDYKHLNLKNINFYNSKELVKTNKYIVDNFDVIIPGHASTIIKNKEHSDCFNVSEF